MTEPAARPRPSDATLLSVFSQSLNEANDSRVYQRAVIAEMTAEFEAVTADLSGRLSKMLSLEYADEHQRARAEAIVHGLPEPQPEGEPGQDG